MPLARLNSAFLESAAAPNHILFAVETIDDRLPSEDDGYSWPHLLRLYEPRPLTNDLLLVLDRRDHPRSIVKRLLLSQSLSLNQKLILPRNIKTPVWLEIDVPHTRVRTVANFLLRESLFYIALTTTDGQTSNYRLLPETATGGFVLCPMVLTTADFLSLYHAMDGNVVPNAVSVDSFCVLGGATSPRNVSVRVFSIEYAVRPIRTETGSK